MRNTLIVIAVLMLGAGTASAGGSPKSWGVGVESMVYGPSGISVVYDQGDFDAGAFLGFANDDFLLAGPEKTVVDAGFHFWYHAHSTAMSDFGVGGGLGFRTIDFDDDNMDGETEIYVDLGGHIRMFMVSNVALSAGAGISIGTADVDGVALDGELVGQFGIHYFFF